jgi:glycosyltransferase involved in cell wall biosynthesis
MNALQWKKASNFEVGSFAGKLGLQQRVLPFYRAEFFDTLAAACEGGLELFAGYPQPEESIQVINQLDAAFLTPAKNLHFGRVSSPVYFLWQRGLIPWLKRWDPDVLILEANPRYFSNRRAIQWMHARKRPVIGWGLGAPPIAGQSLAEFQRRLRQGYLLSCDALIAYSQRGAQEFQELGFPKSRIFVATNAVAPPPRSPPPERAASFSDQPVVLFIGRLQARKRIDNLLHACAGLPASLQPRLVIVGEGPAREELQNLAKEIYPAAEFPGSRQAEELEPYFQRADLFVLPGTGGLAVQEAMAHGLPVLVAEADGTQGDMVRPENGWLIPPGDLGALQNTLQEALSDPVRLRRMGDQSYRIAEQEVNILAMAQVFLRAIEAVQSITRG